MTELNFSTFPILTTERLTLRALKDTDDRSIFFLRSDESVNKYIGRIIAKNIDDAKAFIAKISDAIKQKKSLYWAICLKDRPELIGTICLWNFSEDKTAAEIGYELHPSYQGQGIMDEAFKAVLAYAFQSIGVKQIEAFTHRDNESSKRLLMKNNFKLDPGRDDEGNSNNVVFTLC